VSLRSADVNDNYQNEEPIVALATPSGRSALAIIRLSGKGTHALLQPSFSRELSQSAQMIFGRLVDLANQRLLDEVMIAPFMDGSGYTGEEAAEIFCHGNPFIIRSIIDYLRQIGFRLALPGEFTYRAVRSGKIDLTQAEAVHEVITASTSYASKAALGRLGGGLGRDFQSIYQAIVNRLGAVEAYLDYPEAELDEFVWQPLEALQERLRRYLNHEPVAQMLREGAQVVIAGEPNVGKSSLFNWLIGENRAIVSSVAGTTRDYLEVMIDLGGYPICLVDTAGLHASTDAIEQLGIAKSYEQCNAADLILYLTTADKPLALGELAPFADKILHIQNKCDDDHVGVAVGAMGISVQNQLGLEALLERMIQRLDPSAIASRSEVQLLGSVRQKDIVQEALRLLGEAEALAQTESLDLVAFSLRTACGCFAQLLGSNVQEDAMDAMFRQFCLGK
jgi:tRNA modification GTPase